MPARIAAPGIAALVVSPRRWLREMLAGLLLDQGLAQVVDFGDRLEDARPTENTRLLVWDADRPDRKTEARLRAEHPQLHLVSLERANSLEELLAALSGSPAHRPSPCDQLTRLESEVLLAVASGERNAEIARRMRRSTKTVEKHRANAQRKLGLRNVAQLTAFAIQQGLLRPESILTAARER